MKDSQLCPSRSIQSYLHLAVRLFIASSGNYDPLRTSLNGSESQNLVNEGSEVDNFEMAKLSVQQSRWSSAGLDNSGDFLRRLFEDDGFPIEAKARDMEPPPLLSYGLLRMLQSLNAESSNQNYAGLSDPPDLYSSLHEEQIPPPPKDMTSSDPDLIPREQELRFDGDLCTPRWIRGYGNKTEGWCGICKPGRWLVLKNSAFWYDKSFTHGINGSTGAPFQEPEGMRMMDGIPDVWEGFCGVCGDWVALVSSKKGSTWFRHALKIY